MSSSTTDALSRRPLVQVLRSVTDPRDGRGARHDLLTVLSLAVTGVLAGCRGLTAILGVHHRPDRRRPTVPRGGGGSGSSVGVDHPPGPAGPGPR